MFASPLLHTGGPSSFTPTYIPDPESFLSPPSFVPDSSSSWPHFPTIHVSRSRKALSAALVLKGMSHSSSGTDDDDETKVEERRKVALPPIKIEPEPEMGPRRDSTSPGTSAAIGIAAMSLRFIINDDSENSPDNQALDDVEEVKDESKEDSIALPQHSPAPSPPSLGSSGFQVTAILNTVCAKPDCYRTIRGPEGSFCKYHKQSRFCRADGCNKSAKTGGYCISHGGGKRCSFADCTKSAKQGGLCISHGGGKRCSETGCTKSALVGGYCSAHGGGRKCKTSNCSKTALLGGYCIAHGGGKRCQVDGCSKSAVGGLLCVSHGGGKRCQAEGCNKGAVRNGVCIRHGAKREGSAASGNSSDCDNSEPSFKVECSP